MEENFSGLPIISRTKTLQMQKRYLFLQGLFLSLLGGSLLILGVGCDRSASPFSQSAEKALSTFELPPGFKIELIASEPLISDPVDMAIDEEGRMYVVEMHGY